LKTLFIFLKTTILGGLIFLLPLALVAMVGEKLLHLLAKFVTPLAKALPFESALGIQTPYFLAIFILLIASFLAGLVGRTAIGSRAKSWLENVVLQLVPGYTLLSSLAEQAGDPQTGAMSTALLGSSGRWEFCFIVERHPNGYFTVFRPGAPKPTSGAVFIVAPEQVREIDVPVADAMRCLMRDGGGSVDLLRDQLKPKEGE